MAYFEFIKKEDIRLYLLSAMAFILPLSKFLVPFLILFIGIEWVLRKRWKQGFFDLTYLGFFTLFFFYQLLSLLWSENWEYGGADISAKLSLLLMPLFLGTKDNNLNFMKIFEWLIYGTLLLFFINMSSATYIYFTEGDGLAFFYSKLSPEFHVAYASLYCITAIPVLYYLYTNQYRYFKNIWVVSGFVAIESVHVILLNSKASFIAMMFVYLLLFFYFLKTKWFLSFILPAVLILTVSIGTLFSFEYLYIRFFGGFEIFKPKSERTITKNFRKKDVNKDFEAPVVSSQVRVIAWKSALEIIEKEPFGVGIGDRKDVFLKNVGSKGHERFVKKGLNTHNQYLQVLLAIGIPGLVIFLINLFYPIFQAFRIHDFIFLAFISNIAINMLFESMLEVQAGIIFYAFFAVLFVKQMKEGGFTFPRQ